MFSTAEKPNESISSLHRTGIGQFLPESEEGVEQKSLINKLSLKHCSLSNLSSEGW